MYDLSGLGTKAAERRFMLAFLTALYRGTQGSPVHLVIDEADMFAPQKLLDKDGCKKMPHKQIAEIVHEKYGVGPWWCQMVTVGYEQSRGLRISRVVLIGGLANMPGLANYVKQRIPRDVLVGNVFARLVYPPELTPILQHLSNSLAIAVGAAMRET